MRWLAVVGLLLSLLPFTAAAQSACSFQNGFATLATLLPDAVGSCTTAEQTEAAYPGWVVQHTTTGMMAWRGRDGFLGFTDGNWLWRLLPDGTLTHALAQPVTTPTPNAQDAAVQRGIRDAYLKCEARRGLAYGTLDASLLGEDCFAPGFRSDVLAALDQERASGHAVGNFFRSADLSGFANVGGNQVQFLADLVIGHTDGSVDTVARHRVTMEWTGQSWRVFNAELLSFHPVQGPAPAAPVYVAPQPRGFTCITISFITRCE